MPRIAGAVTAGLSLLGILVALTQGSFTVSSVAVVVGAGIVALLGHPQSRHFFAARGTRWPDGPRCRRAAGAGDVRGGWSLL